MRSTIHRSAAALLAAALLAVPAIASEGSPQGSKEKERHAYRDVQLGLSHPSTHGKSTQTAAPPPPVFPWSFFFLPFVSPSGPQTPPAGR